MVDEKECIICLEPPAINNPIFLIACGCKVGWFHESCKNQWLDSLFQNNSFEIKCPACRRHVKMKINYSFDYRAGPEQNFLQKTFILFLSELLLSISLFFNGVYYALLIPCQSIVIFCLPFMLYRNQSIFFYLKHIRARAFVIGVYVVFHILYLNTTIHTNSWRTYYHLGIPGAIQTLMLLLTHLQDHPPAFYRNPLLPFAISREIVYVDKRN